MVRTDLPEFYSRAHNGIKDPNKLCKACGQKLIEHKRCKSCGILVGDNHLDNQLHDIGDSKYLCDTCFGTQN